MNSVEQYRVCDAVGSRMHAGLWSPSALLRGWARCACMHGMTMRICPELHPSGPSLLSIMLSRRHCHRHQASTRRSLVNHAAMMARCPILYK